MKSIRPLQLLGVASLGAVMTASAFAQDNTFYYWGLSAGQSHSQIDDRLTTNSLLRTQNAPSSYWNETQDTAYKLFGGYQLTPNFALEGGYFNLGKFSYSTALPGGTMNGRYEVEGLNLDLVGTMPLSAKWTALARLGVQHAMTRDAFSGPGLPAYASVDNSQRANNMKVGLGLQYEISPSVLVRGEAERYRVKDGLGNNGDVNLFSVSLVFPFGRTAPRPVVVAQAPAYVAPPPPPQPMVVTPPPPPQPMPVAPLQTVQFSADSLFSFDKAVISADGKSALNEFAGKLRGTRFSMISVEGHTDRLGSTAYNQKLSEERADAVKAYLVSGAGVEPTKIRAMGHGESKPVTNSADCKGTSATKALIACLQPDRRVDVEVTGER
ncbi:MAG: OmpA family protein [Rhodoferax sp.]